MRQRTIDPAERVDVWRSRSDAYRVGAVAHCFQARIEKQQRRRHSGTHTKGAHAEILVTHRSSTPPTVHVGKAELALSHTLRMPSKTCRASATCTHTMRLLVGNHVGTWMHDGQELCLVSLHVLPWNASGYHDTC